LRMRRASSIAVSVHNSSPGELDVGDGESVVPG
jgi:hypothetical protein